MQACVERFQALPGGAEMMASRYPPLQPAIAELQQLPPLSLGYRYAQLILDQGYDPEFFWPRPIQSDAQWLTQRIATTHDIHHVVGGFCTRPEGEAGVLAITACQIAFPAFVSLVNAATLAHFGYHPCNLLKSTGRLAMAPASVSTPNPWSAPAGRRVGSAP
jgi:ubiquinone biosynthesis protein Coq4